MQKNEKRLEVAIQVLNPKTLQIVRFQLILKCTKQKPRKNLINKGNLYCTFSFKKDNADTVCLHASTVLFMYIKGHYGQKNSFTKLKQVKKNIGAEINYIYI